VLDAHYARVRNGLVDLADQTQIPELARAYDAAKRRVDEAKREQDRIANLLRAELGEHEGANFDGGRVLWSERKGSVDWKRAAIDAGVSEEQAEAYRRQPSRALRVTVKGDD